MSKELTRVIEFTTKGNTYTITFPKVGALIDIESKKASLAKGEYGTLISSNTVSAFNALNFIDMISYLTTLCPEILKDLKVNDIKDLDIMDAKELLDDFSSQVLPWINEWRTILNTIKKTEEEVHEPEE